MLCHILIPVLIGILGIVSAGPSSHIEQIRRKEHPKRIKIHQLKPPRYFLLSNVVFAIIKYMHQNLIGYGGAFLLAFDFARW